MAEDESVPSRAQPTTARGRRTRTAIVDSAAQLMYERSVAATSIDDVLAASGTGKSQMYHYFSDKADLVKAVIETQLQRVMAAQPGLRDVDSWRGLEMWAANAVAVHLQPGGPFACPLGSLAAELKNDPAFRPVLDRAFRLWQSPIGAGLRVMADSGQLSADADPDALAAMLVGALQGGMLLAKVAGDVAPLRDLVRAAMGHVETYRLTPLA